MFSPILQRSVANLSNLHTTFNNCNNNENLKIFLWFSGKREKVPSRYFSFLGVFLDQQLLERWLFLKANKWDKTIVKCEPEKVMFLDELCKLWYLEHNSRSQLFHHLPLVSVAPLNLPTPYNSCADCMIIVRFVCYSPYTQRNISRMNRSHTPPTLNPRA